MVTPLAANFSCICRFLNSSKVEDIPTIGNEHVQVCIEIENRSEALDEGHCQGQAEDRKNNQFPI